VDASLVVDADDPVAQVDPRIFGSFVEHLGRVVYTGLYEPSHPDSDDEGFRRDVLEHVRDSGITLVRYPGGNFVSAYRWEDGVGPRETRPPRAEPAWRALETNQFGTDEFMSWVRKAGVEPMMVVNLGTRGVGEAQDLVEYCNLPGGTYWSERRRHNGSPAPHGIRLWGLGNEMDGEWQVAHKTADEYGRIAAETARGMRMMDPTIELVAAGSSLRGMQTFPQWDATVLEYTYDDVDYLGLHGYYYHDELDIGSLLAVGVDLDLYLDEAIATCDYIKAKKRSRKTMYLSFDEWNVTYRNQPTGTAEPWTISPRLAEYDINSIDAVVIGSLLLAFLRHAGRVRIACQSLLVNAGGLVRTEPGGPAWRQASYYPFRDAARWARGSVVHSKSTTPRYESSAFGPVPYLDAVAIDDPEAGRLSVFAVNRHPSEELRVCVRVRGGRRTDSAQHVWLAGNVDRPVSNSAASPDALVPQSATVPLESAEELLVNLPPLSWNVIILPASTL
jgi:alpha-N-arabinofuranosidase